MNDVAERVYSVVLQIPKGRVATYGQVADLVEGVRVSAREVGAIMAICPSAVPWHRVVGAGGNLPVGKRDPRLRLQQTQILELEGVGFLPNGCVDMAVYQLYADTPHPALPLD